jgi:hypothetical protein
MTAWISYENGGTIGLKGSEGGEIVRDEEHMAGARLTLERETLRGVPFAITCGVYGWLVHTRFFADEPTAMQEFERMRGALEAILNLLPLEGMTDAQLTEAAEAATEAVSAFMEQYP